MNTWPGCAAVVARLAHTARHPGVWLAWDEVAAIAKELDIPHVPVVYVLRAAVSMDATPASRPTTSTDGGCARSFDGAFESLTSAKRFMDDAASKPSAVAVETKPEGFVIR